MGGVHVDADTQMSSIPASFARRRCASGINGANRLGGNSLSDFLVFGSAPAIRPPQYAKENTLAASTRPARPDRPRNLAPFDRGGGNGQGPFALQHDLQEELMQDLVRIVRREG